MMPATIQDRCAPYRAELDAAYAAHPEIPPGVLEAIGDRETLWGWAPEYGTRRLAPELMPTSTLVTCLYTQAQGRPDGTGDWEPRELAGGSLAADFRRSLLMIHNPRTIETLRYMPADKLGWGRGLMQIDLAAHPEFCARICVDGPLVPAWSCARCNIAYAAGVFAAGLKQASGYLPEAICAYNAGWGGVERARQDTAAWERLHLASASEADRLRDLDAVTTGGNYVSNVIDRIRELNAASSGP